MNIRRKYSIILSRLMDNLSFVSYNKHRISVNYLSPGGEKEMKTFVVLKPDEDGVFVVECPALPGCISQGKTKEEALQNIKEAIQLYLEGIQEYNFDKPLETYEVEV
ncbi:MAG: hypothetical protein PWR10_1828 [Halanaerobiales bacterium]|nr:hypothetical protein [Halanaerobiales bacterium]